MLIVKSLLDPTFCNGHFDVIGCKIVCFMLGCFCRRSHEVKKDPPRVAGQMNLVLFWIVILNDSVWIPTHKPGFESRICAETLQPSLSLFLSLSFFLDLLLFSIIYRDCAERKPGCSKIDGRHFAWLKTNDTLDSACVNLFLEKQGKG